MAPVERLFDGGKIVNINVDAVTSIAGAKAASDGIDSFLSNQSEKR